MKKTLNLKMPRKYQGTKRPGNLGHYEMNKHKKNSKGGRRKNSGQRSRI